ncbi:hypothetical protein [Microvirga vignae]|uniref:hypothetical protein n=1 Tax=Microvirga vignae TaxID=1225564 RepID=UPI00063FD6AE|nr:hypothetical protein [Microvirga vignae]
MRSLRFIPLTAIALVVASTMAQAAPFSHREINEVPPNRTLAANADRLFGMPATAPYAHSERWPSCEQGTSWCTASGYPNLRYYREMQGLSY